MQLSLVQCLHETLGSIHQYCIKQACYGYCVSGILKLGRLKHMDHFKFEASQGYRMSSRSLESLSQKKKKSSGVHDNYAVTQILSQVNSKISSYLNTQHMGSPYFSVPLVLNISTCHFGSATHQIPSFAIFLQEIQRHSAFSILGNYLCIFFLKQDLIMCL